MSAIEPMSTRKDGVAEVESAGGRALAARSTILSAASGPTFGAYAGSKAAIEQFVAAPAREVGHRGVTANVVLPGPTGDDGLTAPPAVLEQMVAGTPLGRLGETDDVADVVAFLASDQARWVTDETVHVAGGMR